MDEHTDQTSHEQSDGITEDMLHKSAYEIRQEEEKKAYQKKSKTRCPTVLKNLFIIGNITITSPRA